MSYRARALKSKLKGSVQHCAKTDSDVLRERHLMFLY